MRGCSASWPEGYRCEGRANGWREWDRLSGGVCPRCAPVAQLDRAAGLEPVGRGSSLSGGAIFFFGLNRLCPPARSAWITPVLERARSCAHPLPFALARCIIVARRLKGLPEGVARREQV